MGEVSSLIQDLFAGILAVVAGGVAWFVWTYALMLIFKSPPPLGNILWIPIVGGPVAYAVWNVLRSQGSTKRSTVNEWNPQDMQENALPFKSEWTPTQKLSDIDVDEQIKALQESLDYYEKRGYTDRRAKELSFARKKRLEELLKEKKGRSAYADYEIRKVEQPLKDLYVAPLSHTKAHYRNLLKKSTILATIIIALIIIALFIPLIPSQTEIPIEKEEKYVTTSIIREEIWEKIPTTIDVNLNPDKLYFLVGQKAGSGANKDITGVLIGDFLEGPRHEKFQTPSKSDQSVLYIFATTKDTVPSNQTWNFNVTLTYKIEGIKWRLFGKTEEYISEKFTINGSGEGRGNQGNCTLYGFIDPNFPLYKILPAKNLYFTENEFLYNEELGIEPKVTLLDIKIDHSPIYADKRSEETATISETKTSIVTTHNTTLNYESLFQIVLKKIVMTENQVTTNFETYSNYGFSFQYPQGMEFVEVSTPYGDSNENLGAIAAEYKEDEKNFGVFIGWSKYEFMSEDENYEALMSFKSGLKMGGAHTFTNTETYSLGINGHTALLMYSEFIFDGEKYYWLCGTWYCHESWRRYWIDVSALVTPDIDVMSIFLDYAYSFKCH